MENSIFVEIIKAKSGQFLGKIYRENEEIGGIAGCKNELEVLEIAQETYGNDIPFVIDKHSGARITSLISQHNLKNGD